MIISLSEKRDASCSLYGKSDVFYYNAVVVSWWYAVIMVFEKHGISDQVSDLQCVQYAKSAVICNVCKICWSCQICTICILCRPCASCWIHKSCMSILISTGLW